MQLFNEAERMTASPLGSQKIKVNRQRIFGCQINGSYAEDDQSILRFAFCVHPDSCNFPAFILAMHMVFNLFFFPKLRLEILCIPFKKFLLRMPGVQ